MDFIVNLLAAFSGHTAELNQALDLGKEIVADLINIATKIVAFCSLVAAATPHGAEGSVWYYVRRLLNFMAINVGKAANVEYRGKA